MGGVFKNKQFYTVDLHLERPGNLFGDPADKLSEGLLTHRALGDVLDDHQITPERKYPIQYGFRVYRFIKQGR